MWLTTVVLGVIFLCNSVFGGEIPDVTTIYELGCGSKYINEEKSSVLPPLDDDAWMPAPNPDDGYKAGCIKDVKGRVHARTNALGLGFVDEERQYLDSKYTDIPNITCDSNFGSDEFCTSWDFETDISRKNLNGLTGIPMRNGRAYEMNEEESLEIYKLREEIFLYFTKKPQRIEDESDFIVTRIGKSSNGMDNDNADLFYNCNKGQECNNYGPFTLMDRDGGSVSVCCSYHHNSFQISTEQDVLNFEFSYQLIIINSLKLGIKRKLVAVNIYYASQFAYFSITTYKSAKIPIMTSPTAIEIDEVGMTSSMFTPTSKNFCFSIVFNSPSIESFPLHPELKISFVGFLNEESTVLHIDSVKNGLNTKLLNVSLENFNPIKLKIAQNGPGNITIIRVSSCSPEGEEVAELPSSISVCPWDQRPRPGYLSNPSLRVYTTTVDTIDPLTLSQTKNCKNRGVYTSAGCACTPGFTGPTCEIGCGRNRFGHDCEGLCSFHDKECRGLLLCTKYTGCQCAPGYSDNDCTKACDPGWYGNDCSQRCGHCAGNSTCDIYTGECAACEGGYLAPHCQTESVYYGSKPELSSPSYGTIIVTFDPNNYVTHSEPPQMYQIQIREKGSVNQWMVYTSKSIQTSNEESGKETTVSEKIEGLKIGFLYEVRVLLIDVYFLKYDGHLVQVAEILTKCHIPDFYDYRLSSNSINNTAIQFSWNYVAEDRNLCPLKIFEVTWREGWMTLNKFISDKNFTLTHLIPGLPIKFKVRALTSGGFWPYSETLLVSTAPTELPAVRNLRVVASQSSSVEVSWDPPRGAGDTQLQYTVSYKCVNRPACSPGCQNVSEAQLTQETTSITLSALLPFTMYQVTASAAGGAQSSIFAGTSKVVPTEIPVHIPEKTVRTNTSLTVFWDEGPVCTGFLLGYNYQITKAFEKFKILASGFTKESHASFYNLSASTDYEIKVFVVTVAGWNPSAYLGININTSATVPEAVTDLTVYKRGRGMLGLRWATPRATYGPLKSFTVSYSLGQKVVSHTIEPTHCVVWPELYCHTIEGLRSNKQYNVSVSARNAEVAEDGEFSFASAVTKENSPSAPVNLKLTDSSSTSVELEWNYPYMANGIVRSFLISVEETEKYEQESCCQIYPIIEIAVKEESQTYSAEVSGLHPASTYFVSVSGKTVGLGPSQSLVVSTRPPSLPLTKLPRIVPAVPELSWLPQENLPEVNNSDVYTSLIKAHIVLGLFNENQTDLHTESGITDPKLESLLKQRLQKPFFFISEYNQDEDLDLIGPLDSDSSWGQPPAALSRGISYQLVAAHVIDYNGILNIDLRISTLFSV